MFISIPVANITGKCIFQSCLSSCSRFGILQIRFSIAFSSFMFSASVGLADLSEKISIFEVKEDIYHSLQNYSLWFDVAGILFNNLLNQELKSLMGSLDSDFKLEISLIKVATDLSSLNLVKNYSWKAFQLLMDPAGSEKYHDPAAPCKVYGKSLTTTSSSVTPFRFIDNIKLFYVFFC